MSYFRDQLNTWLKGISIDTDRVLDVGAGTNPARKTAKINCREYVTLDIDESAVPDIVADIQVQDFLSNIKSPKLSEQFDAIFCLELMEYTYLPTVVLFNLFSLLKPGGKLFISFPFVYPIHKPIGQDYLRYTEDGARKVLELVGFDVRNIQPRVARNPEILSAFYGSDGMHTRKDHTVPHTGYLVVAQKPKPK